VLAFLFTIRVIVGGVIIGAFPSFWLMGFCIFLFLSLALIKRCSELITMERHAATRRTDALPRVRRPDIDRHGHRKRLSRSTGRRTLHKQRRGHDALRAAPSPLVVVSGLAILDQSPLVEDGARRHARRPSGVRCQATGRAVLLPLWLP